MKTYYETIIIGGGQAGLSTSYFLKQQNRDHIILEKAAQAGNAWRNDRWDSFTLLTPNWTFQLPGAEYQEDDPDGFIPKDEIIARFEQYIEHFQLPVQYQVRVISVEKNDMGQGYLVRTDNSVVEAKNIVVATGLFQRAKLPVFSTDISKDIKQLHSGQYRNPQSLPPGAVLVVGSGQSGCQIAEELYLSGRKVYLCVGSAGRAPRRYRGKDIFEWLHLSGFLDRTVDKLPSPQAKYAANPQVSGRDGGRALNLHQFAHDGVVLLGRLVGAGEHQVRLAPDLKENLAKADKFEADLVKLVDEYIGNTGLDVPVEKLPELRYGYESPIIENLDLNATGITTIIWAMGYTFDFSMIHLPILDNDGYPHQNRGEADYPGLFFVGLPWLYKNKSGLLIGVGEDAKHIVSVMTGVPYVPDNQAF